VTAAQRHLLRRWAAHIARRYSSRYGAATVYLYGSALKRERPRDYDVIVVLPAAQFAWLYARKRVTQREAAAVVEQWAREEYGEAAATNLWARYRRAKVALDKEAWRWTDMVVDVRVLPTSYRRRYRDARNILR
jgi:predicted nucleotidyltransferase